MRLRFAILVLAVLPWGCGDAAAPEDLGAADASALEDQAGVTDLATPVDEAVSLDDMAVVVIDAADASAPVPDLSWDGGHTSHPTDPAIVLQTNDGGVGGANRLLLRGTVLAPGGVLDPGEVLVVDNLIQCVASDCTGAGQANTTIIDTKGIISPGLIDAHNHMAYDFLPEWVPPPGAFPYDHRYQWPNDPTYKDFIRPYSENQTDPSHFCPGAKWAELRSVIHGTTTIQGQTPSGGTGCIRSWGIRNAECSHGLGYDHMRTIISSVYDISSTTAQSLIEDFSSSSTPTTRYVTHMQEGVSGGHVLDEFESYAGRDPRRDANFSADANTHHIGLTLLYPGVSVLIHSISLTEDQLQEVKATDSKIVWSPSSNAVLYGQTAPIRRILELGITTGLGPDWTLSGEDEMLGEMRYALAFGRRQTPPIAELTPQKVWEMATREGAIVVGLEPYIGTLEVGKRADIAVFGRAGPDPYEALIESRAADVRLVLVDGRGYWGDGSLASVTARNPYCEDRDACGVAKYLCVRDTMETDAGTRIDESYEDIRRGIYNMLEGLGDAKYHRGDAGIAELFTCPD